MKINKKKKEPKQKKSLLSNKMDLKTLLLLAQKMLSKGCTLQEVQTITGLTETELKDLSKTTS